MRALFVLATGLFLVAPRAAAKEKTWPAHILIIRHAEKPEDDSAGLSPRGEERAKALPDLFKKSDRRPHPLQRPDFIFATADSKKSRRPRETVKPLAKSLGLKINHDYANEDYGKLVHELFHNPRYAGKTVLICWHHGKIPALADRLGVEDAPRRWKGAVFDRVWRIDFDKKGKTSFLALPQNLLSGDSSK